METVILVFWGLLIFGGEHDAWQRGCTAILIIAEMFKAMKTDLFSYFNSQKFSCPGLFVFILVSADINTLLRSVRNVNPRETYALCH